ncbi:hypothetical protein PRZ48_014695 [Zasmidium cellare]|uniref:tRNA nucleotidyltransferase n=1 Tax=Zasmidium cellare TaxID=395010 RepID=A0ABR0DYZ7_ZASCE|nr:hypothetical protein PRZ48_014695 [Zasmidium cellare]
MAPMLIQEVDDEASHPTTLELTPVETTFRRLLLDVAKHVDESPASTNVESQVALPEDLAKEPLVLRWTGGWVRDKLLDTQSHDIDVAINKMTGYQFGLRMKEYLEIPGNLEKYGLEAIAANEKQSQKAGTTDKSKMVGGLHKIEANPEKSKHLETTTLSILGLDVDLVNLRKETYSDDSRNPQIEFGTPEEDALRRDATVNAMFYNINNAEIEDFTSRGHEDMKAKIIRTPLEPYQTFKDDPLRVLRLIRFASRLGFTIDQAALDAMRNADIKDALRRKISRERVGVELDKSLHGPDPHEAMRLIFDLDLYETIFSDPAVANQDHYKPDIEGWQTVIDALEDMLQSGGTIEENLARDKDERFLAWHLAAIIPYRDAPQPEPSEPGRKPPPPIAVTVAREGVKATNKTSDVINAAIRNQAEISNFVDKVSEKKRRPDKKVEGEDPAARDVLGMAIRKWGGSWRSQVMYSLLVDIANDRERVESIERKYTTFLEHIHSLSLLEVITLKPLLDGKALAKAIGTPPGPWMKDALDVVMAWQLRNPDITDPQQAIEEVKTQRQKNGELTSALIRHFLKLTIRPLFIKASPSTVTEQGRKVTTSALPKKITMEEQDDAVKRPWKSAKDAYSLDLLRWVVGSLDEKIAAEVWPLVVPPILTLIDDWETKYKRIGTERLHSLLRATPPALLDRTGLGEVFEEALLPCLTYLPPLTPQDDSTALLSTVYPCLLTLAHIRYPKDANSKPQSPTATDLNRIKVLSTILRKGILHGYTHSSENPAIVTRLFTNLVPLLDAMGIDSVAHLKYTIPMLVETLAHPLGSGSLSMLDSAVDALKAVIRNAWPRMSAWRGEMLKGLCFCWGNVIDKPEAEALRGKMREVVKMLQVALSSDPDVDLQAELSFLVKADARLAPLFEGLGNGS